ncbi:helix-turn-helix domain-containing protein [Luteimonas sp. XNQY3]|nr:helix-turn-helix domain-containing protein [Luteimonas sp. XNQY3]MCD9004733.1 helix-turn-helix domain-containing protein [Luteimonas sp. XNQY3]
MIVRAAWRPTFAPMKNEQAQFGARLRSALRHAGLGEGATELADLVSAHGGHAVSPQAAHNWIRGKAMPRRRNLKALAKALRVDAEQLYGDAPVSNRRVGEDGAAFSVSAHDQHAIDAYLALPAERRKVVRQLIGLLAQPG